MPILPENKDRYPKDWKPHPITGSKVVLTTAHVYDHRPEAASLLNLAALCQKCHLGHDAEHHAETRRRRQREQQPDLFELRELEQSA